MKKLYGVTSAMVTPMLEDERIDRQGLEQLTTFLIDKGVDCLFPLGTTGEMFKLSVEERKEVAETVIQAADKRVNVFIHAGAMNTKDTLELADHAYQSGADGIGVVSPAFFNAGDVEIIEYYQTISAALPGDFPIYLYNIPQLSGNDLSVDVVKELAEHCGNIVGLKYSYPDFPRLSDYLHATPEYFSILTGADGLFLPALAMGCDGVVSGVSGVFPEPFVELYDKYQKYNLEEARQTQRAAGEIIKILQAGANMSYFKKALDYRGLRGGFMRSPQKTIPPEQKKAAREHIDTWLQEYHYTLSFDK
ncbi:dihydrodipicolinate synthase family protein [Salibacterium halotolerans]|uniref:4-hydroxy-tetrahydrodipicolinate synthase n=1 Tax=Salibacterium halotolerans TaxID=1884432 RepID=A0A1I5KX17_9BACI|nr:dihydrodipicolinate synthase family protein [Salibacterium halotolerans]SFO89537.1 4-hydroxy-tetrahydrodipicolinate synthase [Salibacterium halotolerans]